MERILSEEIVSPTALFDKIKTNCDSNIRSCCWTSYARDILDWMSQPYKESILDDVERKYLSDVIRPFRKDIVSISKYSFTEGYSEKREYIKFSSKSQSWILPSFEAGTMYKGMKTHKEYTLKELGL